MLYIVATPIGNLKDITLRVLEILKEVDLILAEDTRQTRKLLTHYQIVTPLQSYHQHSGLQKIDYILDLLRRGKNLALVTDAGTPGIADPGNRLISLAIQQFNNLTIVPIPGPSALTAALSVSGLPTDKFLFLGFPPAKKKRQKFFEQVVNSKHTVVFYESCHRILRTLGELDACLRSLHDCHPLARPEDLSERDPRIKSEDDSGPSPDGGNKNIGRQLVVCRELTKKFETIYRGDCAAIINQLKKENHEPRGEFVVIVGF